MLTQTEQDAYAQFEAEMAEEADGKDLQEQEPEQEPAERGETEDPKAGAEPESEGEAEQAADAGAQTKDEPQADQAEAPEQEAVEEQPAAEAAQAAPASTLAPPDGYIETALPPVRPPVAEFDKRMQDLEGELAQAQAKFAAGDGEMDAAALGKEAARITAQMMRLQGEQDAHVRDDQAARAHDQAQWQRAFNEFSRAHLAAGGTIDWTKPTTFPMLLAEVERLDKSGSTFANRFELLRTASDNIVAALGLPAKAVPAPAAAAKPAPAKPRARAVGPVTLANLPTNTRGSAEIAASGQDPLSNLAAEKAEARLAQMSPAEYERYLYGE